MNSIEYNLIEASNGIDVSTDNGRLEYLKKCADILSKLHDDIAIDLYASKLAEKFKISKTAIMSEINARKKKRINYEQKKKFESIVKPKLQKDEVNPERQANLRAAKAEEEIISILIFNPDLISTVKSQIDENSFVTNFNKRVYLRVLEVIEQGHNFDVSMLAGDFTPAECGRVAMYQNRMVKGDNAKRELADCIKVLLTEKSIKSNSTESLTDEEWASTIREIASNKK